MNNLLTRLENRRYESSASMLLLLLLAQRFIIAFKYFPAMDDWFLYFGRKTFPVGERVLDLATRPFAGLAELYLITPLADNIIIVELVLLVMLALSAYFFARSFDKLKLASGSLFMVVLALTPTGFEGLYWIAAASRIVTSLFFVSLSAFLLTLWLEKRRVPLLIPYAVCSALAVGFYETFMPIYFIVNIAVIIFRKKKAKDFLTAFIPIAASGALAVYYMMNSAKPEIAVRADSVPFDEFFEHAQYAFERYREMLVGMNMWLVHTSFIDGLKTVTEHWSVGILLVLFAAAFGFVSRRGTNRGVIKGLVLGILLMCAGMVLNFFIGYVRVPFRLAVPLLPGAAVIVDTIISLIPGKFTYGIISGALALVFSICNIGQLTLYSYTNTQDEKFGDRMAQYAPITDRDRVLFLCGANQYWYNDRPQHLEYVKSVTENYAALTGMLQYKLGTCDINNITPLYDGAVVGKNNYTADWIDMVYYDKYTTLHECTVTELDGNYIITDENGNDVGTLTANGENYVYTCAQ